MHSNVAKQYDKEIEQRSCAHTDQYRMLYDFYTKQNKKKAGTVHATYLVTGRQQQRHTSQSNETDGANSQGDLPMRSSPFPSSSAPQHDSQESVVQSIRLLTIAKEEDLEAAKSQLDEVECIHIYSLEPNPIKDVQILSDCNRRVAAESHEDPLQAWKQYGVIQNAHVKRRTNKRPAPAPAAAPTSKSAAKPALAVPAAKKEEIKAKDKPVKAIEPTKAAIDVSDADSDASSKTSKSGKPPVLKRDSSSIFKSFAKSKPKAKKEPAQSQPSAEASPAISDDEADEDSMMVDAEPTEQPTGKSKKDREDELRKMMEAEDEPMDDASAAEAEEQEPEPEPEPEPEAAPETAKEEPKEEAQVSNGRRRGCNVLRSLLRAGQRKRTSFWRVITLEITLRVSTLQVVSSV